MHLRGISMLVTTGLVGACAAAQDLPPSGALGAVMEHDPSRLPAITVYRPRDLPDAGRLPVVAWGNGGCRALGGARARRFLLELASHGFLIVSPGKPGPDAELQPTSNRDPSPRLDPVPPGHDETQAAELTAAIDWAIAEGSRQGSVYRGRVDPRRVAVMGHSCGGLQALAIQDDPRISRIRSGWPMVRGATARAPTSASTSSGCASSTTGSRASTTA